MWNWEGVINSMTKLIFATILAITLSACSGIPVSQDFEQGFDFSGLKTFAWDANEEDQWGIAESNQLVDRRLRSAIENTLPQ